MKDDSSANDLKEIKLEIKDLSKSVQMLTQNISQMSSLLIQILSNLELVNEYSDEEGMDLVENDKFLSRIKELNDNTNTRAFE